MTQKEFTERTGITPTPEQFDYIHAVYMNTSMDKDQFCEEFKKHGESEILKDVHVRAVNYELQCKQKQDVIDRIAHLNVVRTVLEQYLNLKQDIEYIWMSFFDFI